jgi:hypothetical protein
MMQKRKILVQAVKKSLAEPRDTDIEEAVQNCTPEVISQPKSDIPKDQYLYGIRLKNGEYKHVIASDIVNAACRLKVALSDIKRAMPIKYGG